MANTGIGLIDRGLEALEEGGRQAVKGVGQQVIVGAKSVATQVTGSDFTGKPQESHDPKAANNSHVSGTADVSEAMPTTAQSESSDKDTQDMLKALYGPTQPQSNTTLQVSTKIQTKEAESSELANTRQKLEQEKLQKHVQQHNEVYFAKLNKPEEKAGQKEESQQERVERQKAEEEKKKQMELEEKQKKEEKIKAPSKNSAEHERKLGG